MCIMCPIPAYPAYMNAPAEMGALLDSLPWVYALMLYTLILPHCLCLQKEVQSLLICPCSTCPDFWGHIMQEVKRP